MHQGLAQQSRASMRTYFIMHARLLKQPVWTQQKTKLFSISDMSKSHGGKPAPFPNCKQTLRDAAHSARRILLRLWKADELLDYVYRFFMLIASIIHWSDDHRRLYAECTGQSTDAAVSTNFGHMRAAKHRIESLLSPLSRAVLDPSGKRLCNKSMSFVMIVCFAWAGPENMFTQTCVRFC